MPIPAYVTPGNPVEALWGNDVVDSLSDLQSLVDAVAPIGICIPFGGDTEPSTSWMFARGQTVRRDTYSILFARYGSKFGNGDGTLTFHLPDMRGRMPAGYWPGGTYFPTLGLPGGSYDLPVVSHQHGVNLWSGYQDADHAHSFSTGGENTLHNHTAAWGEVWHATASPADNVNVFAVRIGDGITINIEKFNTASYPTGTESAYHAHSGATVGVSANHRHATNGSSDFAGVTGVGKNIPPAIPFNFIVRVL